MKLVTISAVFLAAALALVVAACGNGGDRAGGGGTTVLSPSAAPPAPAQGAEAPATGAPSVGAATAEGAATAVAPPVSGGVSIGIPVNSGTLPAPGITVSGVGSVKVVPDRADVALGVETQAASAEEALGANSAAMRKVIDALRGAGVAAEDIQTQQVYLSPRYTSDGQAIVGYTAVNSVLARVQELDRAGAVIDAAVSAGANQAYSLALVVSDQTGPYSHALEAAIGDARVKAEALARAAGVSLGDVTSVLESGGVLPPPIPYAAEVAAAGKPAPPIQPGVQEVQANVTVTFAIAGA